MDDFNARTPCGVSYACYEGHFVAYLPFPNWLHSSLTESDLRDILCVMSSVSGLSLKKLKGLEAQTVRMDY